MPTIKPESYFSWSNTLGVHRQLKLSKFAKFSSRGLLAVSMGALWMSISMPVQAQNTIGSAPPKYIIQQDKDGNQLIFQQDQGEGMAHMLTCLQMRLPGFPSLPLLELARDAALAPMQKKDNIAYFPQELLMLTCDDSQFSQYFDSLKIVSSKTWLKFLKFYQDQPKFVPESKNNPEPDQPADARRELELELKPNHELITEKISVHASPLLGEIDSKQHPHAGDSPAMGQRAHLSAITA